MLSLFPLLLAPPALAGDAEAPTTVFVSELRPADPDAGGIAGLLSYALLDALDASEGLRALGPDDAPDFGEHSARVYLIDCPRGQEGGCAYVVGEAVEADYAIAGVVGTLASGGHQVEITIVDIAGAREALHFTLDLDVGEDEALLTGLKMLLLGVIEGDEGVVQDIRDMGGVAEAPRVLDPDQARRQLDALSEELGDEGLDTRADREVARQTYTMDDLADEMGSDAAKPWERLGLTPKQYMDYKNSGLTLQAWEQLAAGRRFQLTVRGGGGLGRGPTGTRYYGQYAVEPATGAIVEVYAWEARTSSSSPQAGLWVGFGLLPVLEVMVGGGWVGGNYVAEIQQFVVGTENFPRPAETYPVNNLQVEARALAVLLPTSRVHPVAGGGVGWVLSTPLDSHILPPQASRLPVFPRATTTLAKAVGGVEVDVNPLVDLYAYVPVGVAIGGRLLQEYREGGGVLEGSLSPTEPSAFSAGLELGVCLRFLGRPPPRRASGPLEDDL